MIAPSEWEWRGLAGHFCSANDCRFHLCTRIGNVLVSTVGAYYPRDAEEMETIGLSHHYETYVFQLDANGEIESHAGIDFESLALQPGQDPYECDTIAEQMHMRMCLKWAEEQQ